MSNLMDRILQEFIKGAGIDEAAVDEYILPNAEKGLGKEGAAVFCDNLKAWLRGEELGDPETLGRRMATRIMPPAMKENEERVEANLSAVDQFLATKTPGSQREVNLFLILVGVPQFAGGPLYSKEYSQEVLEAAWATAQSFFNRNDTAN